MQRWRVRLGLNPASAGRTYGSVSTQDRTHGVGERLQALPKESRRRSKRFRALEVESPILVSLLESVFDRKEGHPWNEEVIVKELPSAIDSLTTPEERATWGYPPADRAAADVYSRILSTLCKKGKGITGEDLEAAYRLALEIEKDVPDRATVQRWCARLNFNRKYLPHRRSLGPGEGQSMTERWNKLERALKSP